VVWANANSTNTGRFTLGTSSGDWGGPNDDGFLLFRTVSGDFTATIQVISATAPDYHDFGLMARAAAYSEGGVGEDYVAARYYAPGTGTHFRSVDNDVETNYDSSGLHSFLKLNRTGNLFTYTRADDSAFTLNTVTSSITRSDLDGLSLQVGIWQATYTGNLGTAVLDNFTLITPVPEPSAACLAAFGALALLRRLRRP
jgi:hypothetical protein